MSVRVRIDRLVVDAALAGRDPTAMAQALQAELTRRLAGAPAPRHAHSVAALTAPPATGGDARRLGRSAGASLADALGRIAGGPRGSGR